MMMVVKVDLCKGERNKGKKEGDGGGGSGSVLQEKVENQVRGGIGRK